MFDREEFTAGEKGSAMEEDNPGIFENMKRVAQVLVETFGRNCEVAIHDFASLPYSLVHVEGEVTRRKRGAPITDLALKALQREGDQVEDICNYKTTTKQGRVLKSSTAFIRDDGGRVIGAFCVNYDVTDFLNSVALIEDFAKTVGNHEGLHETFASSLNETIESIVDQVVHKAGKQPGTMSKAEKVQMVEVLEMYGVFSLKGAVEYVATVLGVSRYTVYNYLNEVRAEKNHR